MSKNNLNGFKVLSVKYSSQSTSEHQVFMKEHSVRNQTEDKPIGRTLFLINIPPWATEDSLKNAFSKTSPVTSATFSNINTDEETKSGFKSAFVVFDTSPGLYKALKLKKLPPLSSEECAILLGMSKWMKEYNDGVDGQKRRQDEAVRNIAKYDADEEIRKNKEKNGEPDDEGWTVVTKKGRNPGLSRKESVHQRLAEKSLKKDKVLKNFYRHQIRQEKRDQLATLRKKAEEDKKKILALRQRRAFKPF